MTKVLSSTIGSYPRIGAEKDHQRLRRALQHLQNKEISAHAFNDVEQSVIQEIIREQLTTDLDEVTDGAVSWSDPISHFCRKVSGIQQGGLTRFFDTNTYYRTPIFVGKARRKASAVTDDFTYAQSVSFKPIRPVLMGPYTLALLSQSENKTFNTFKARFSFFTDLIKSEVRALVRAGAKTIQIDEPGFVRFQENEKLFKKSIETLNEAASPSKLALNLNLAPLSGLVPFLKTLPVSILQLDFSFDGKKLFDKLSQSPPTQTIGFGFLDGRSTKLEAIDPILRQLKNWAEKTGAQEIYLTPSSGLEFLPRAVALEKLKLISKIKGEINAKQEIPAY